MAAELARTAGALRERLDFQQRELDESGARLGSWLTAWSARASIQYLHGGEDVLAQRIQGQGPVIITVRYNQAARTIDNSWRAVDARDPSRVFNLKAPEPTARHDWIDILATQQTGQLNDG